MKPLGSWALALTLGDEAAANVANGLTNGPSYDEFRTLTADDVDAAFDEVAADTAPGSLSGYV